MARVYLIIRTQWPSVILNCYEENDLMPVLQRTPEDYAKLEKRYVEWLEIGRLPEAEQLPATEKLLRRIMKEEGTEESVPTPKT
jgi:hypothetical protein